MDILILIQYSYFDQNMLNPNKNKVFINLNNLFYIKGFLFSLQKWLKLRQMQSQPQLKQMTDKYLQIIKPKIHRSHLLNISPQNYGFYCDLLAEDNIKTLKALFEPLRKYEIKIWPHINESQIASQVQLHQLLINPCTNLNRLNLLIPPSNQEFKYWKNCIEIQDRIDIFGAVIHGKGIAAKNLGMPTANLKLCPELQKSLIIYPTGIYLVEFIFLSDEKRYFGAASLGTNPEYENFLDKRVIQVHVFHDFGENLFYGEQVKINLLKLIRLQGQKFQTFDEFLNAMHNDIYVGKSYCS